MAANTDASVALTFTTRDQASPGIQRIGGNLTRLGSVAQGVGKVFSQNATAFLTAGLALSSIGGQASSLLVKFGVLNEKQGDIVNTGFQITAVVLGTVTAVSSLTTALVASSISMGAAVIVAGAWGAALFAVVAATVALSTALEILIDPTKRTGIERLFGFDIPTADDPGAPKTRRGRISGAIFPGVPGRAGIGEAFLGPERRIAEQKRAEAREFFGLTIINQGTIIADEGGMQQLERRLQRVRGEERRTRGITQ